MGKTGVPFHPMTQFHAANAGEVQIKEDDIGLQRERFLVSFFTVIHPVAAPAFCRQKFLHQLPESDVVINHQKSSFHGLISSRPVYPEPVTRVLWSCKSLVRVVNPAKAGPPHDGAARLPWVDPSRAVSPNTAFRMTFGAISRGGLTTCFLKI